MWAKPALTTSMASTTARTPSVRDRRPHAPLAVRVRLRPPRADGVRPGVRQAPGREQCGGHEQRDDGRREQQQRDEQRADHEDELDGDGVEGVGGAGGRAARAARCAKPRAWPRRSAARRGPSRRRARRGRRRAHRRRCRPPGPRGGPPRPMPLTAITRGWPSRSTSRPSPARPAAAPRREGTGDDARHRVRPAHLLHEQHDGERRHRDRHAGDHRREERHARRPDPQDAQIPAQTRAPRHVTQPIAAAGSDAPLLACGISERSRSRIR